jgi:hypothetical protein
MVVVGGGEGGGTPPSPFQQLAYVQMSYDTIYIIPLPQLFCFVMTKMTIGEFFISSMKVYLLSGTST